MPNDLSATPAPDLTVNDAKAAKAELEALIFDLVTQYERRFDCHVGMVNVDYSRNERKQWRATGIRVDVQL